VLVENTALKSLKKERKKEIANKFYNDISHPKKQNYIIIITYFIYSMEW